MKHAFYFVLCSLIVFEVTAAPGQDLSSAPEVGLKLLTGVVTRIHPSGRGPGQPMDLPQVETDSVVVFCQLIETNANSEPEYHEIVSGVSDSEGKFELILPVLETSKTYALRIKAIEGDWNTFTLGSGADEARWLNQGELALEPWKPERVKRNRGPNGGASFPDRSEQSVRKVFFATDRALEISQGTVSIENRNSPDGKLSYGICTVLVDPMIRHDRTLFDLSAFLGRDRYYSVTDIQTVNSDDLWHTVRHISSPNDKQEGLLFIHGYNTSFNDACRRAAQIAYDLKFNGPVFVYSWPSHDALSAYAGDEEMSEWSQPHFIDFLKTLLKESGLKRLHIIAHSMGNRILLNAVYSGKLTSSEWKRLGEIILAAPDVNRLLFEQEIDKNKIGATRVTLYASNRDQAILLSKLFHGFDRVGDTRPEIEVVPGMDSIDASAVDTGLLGHSYIGDSPSVLGDLSELIDLGIGPDKRFGLHQRGLPSKHWWILNP
jgi:esterase/lipase superfamily enzyme